MSETPQSESLATKAPLQWQGDSLVVAPPGDLTGTLFAVPAVRALRQGRPQATFAVVAPEGNRAVWERVEGIDHLIVHPDRASAGAIAALVRESGVTFESSFAWGESAAAAAFVKLGISQRLGPDEGKLAKRLTDPISVATVPAPPGHDLRRYLWPLESLGLETFVAANFPVPELPARPAPPVIGLAPDSDYGGSYQWPAERFAEVAKSLRREHGAELVVLNLPAAGSAARELADRLKEELGDGVQDRVDEHSLGGLLETLPSLSLLVGSDSALIHLAAFTGLPAAVVFGPGDVAGRRPQGKIHRILNAHVACAGCGLAVCPLDHRCMDEVRVEMVVEAAWSILSGGE